MPFSKRQVSHLTITIIKRHWLRWNHLNDNVLFVLVVWVESSIGCMQTIALTNEPSMKPINLVLDDFGRFVVHTNPLEDTARPLINSSLASAKLEKLLPKWRVDFCRHVLFCFHKQGRKGKVQYGRTLAVSLSAIAASLHCHGPSVGFDSISDTWQFPDGLRGGKKNLPDWQEGCNLDQDPICKAHPGLLFSYYISY